MCLHTYYAYVPQLYLLNVLLTIKCERQAVSSLNKKEVICMMTLL